jgi:hypothetical protein
MEDERHDATDDTVETQPYDGGKPAEVHVALSTPEMSLLSVIVDRLRVKNGGAVADLLHGEEGTEKSEDEGDERNSDLHPLEINNGESEHLDQKSADKLREGKECQDKEDHSTPQEHVLLDHP